MKTSNGKGGGRHPGSDLLRTVVRLALTDGRLFDASGHLSARTGSGRACAVCSFEIGPREVEYEVGSPAEAAFAHFPCYLVWQQESEARRSRL